MSEISGGPRPSALRPVSRRVLTSTATISPPALTVAARAVARDGNRARRARAAPAARRPGCPGCRGRRAPACRSRRASHGPGRRAPRARARGPARAASRPPAGTHARHFLLPLRPIIRTTQIPHAARTDRRLAQMRMLADDDRDRPSPPCTRRRSRACASLAREAIELTAAGVADDRRFYLVDERGRMVNGKQLAGLHEIVATLRRRRARARLSRRHARRGARRVRRRDAADVVLLAPDARPRAARRLRRGAVGARRAQRARRRGRPPQGAGPRPRRRGEPHLAGVAGRARAPRRRARRRAPLSHARRGRRARRGARGGHLGRAGRCASGRRSCACAATSGAA